MDGDKLYSIGELSRRTGLTVKTIRFYSDLGNVPPTARSPAGHRLYGPHALARLDLARTLRELGLDLSTARKVLDREASLPEVARAHADALDVRIRTARTTRGPRARTGRRLAGTGRTLPDRGLPCRDPTDGRGTGGRALPPACRHAVRGPRPGDARTDRRGRVVRPAFGPRHGQVPGRPAGRPLRPRVRERRGERLRRWLLARLRTGTDPLVERYWRLLATVNGWPPSSALAPVHAWFSRAAA
ncbi:MerR family transcriptional regulator [Streptomyces sp. NPDC001194]|uniref:MerR family transcriptional regulator n=1 Tax=Streptomyces sp. NPDC001194 TaxID=3364547 RepID=UPI0036758453